jgi:SWI/SNF-related matrix-associated actin-dependent regulator of chromatin subfamily A3
VSDLAKGTLIVAPVSLLSNWTSQIEQHLDPDTLKVLVFHGKTKSDPTIKFDDYDVVITSYGTLVSDYKALPANGAPRTGLFGRQWRRVVLDEAHTIRNPNAKMSLAASRLDAVSRWSLTGTPIVNEMSDLYSQMRFLRFSGGFSQSEIFNRLITRPLKNGDTAAGGRLQLLMGGICLRRRKDMKFAGKHIVELPGVDEYLHKIGISLDYSQGLTLDFSEEEKEKYLVLENEAKGLLEKINRGGNTGYSFVLELLLRMRQFSVRLSMLRC